MASEAVKKLQARRAKTRIGTSSRCILWPCEKHPECKGERYIANGRCIGCHRVRMIAKKARRRLSLKYLAQERQKQTERAARPAYQAARLAHRQTDDFKSARALRKRLYQAQLKRAQPPWADVEKIKAVYTEARRRGMTVDHVVPLKHPLVCGLHVHTNLRIMPMVKNAAKGNRWVQP